MSVEEAENTPVAAEPSAKASAEVAADLAVTTLAAAKRYPIAPGYQVNVRSGPGTNYQIVRVLAYGTSVPINCQKPGEWISGPYGTSNLWDCIANGQFVSDAYVHTGSDGYVAPHCS
ncbi:SH3 domain-containing protein [Streptomyces liangshanensis]|uniref:SH3 domain-containing protein n=1 Tax=Streptomyces liangshanensis TaxID=2717324 RepID=A0A6G9GZB2_9ACTN|nr:SH3 domain-containing protein [Streptomyces liangshanensis]QIQ03379.1 SH3 domain-containing protein [Streptomyces liangshanensis]